jgi:hypothetical protein
MHVILGTAVVDDAQGLRGLSHPLILQGIRQLRPVPAVSTVL